MPAILLGDVLSLVACTEALKADVIESTSCRQEYNGSQCYQLKRADLLNKQNNGPFSQLCAVRTSGL